jgi:hypothetical protein
MCGPGPRGRRGEGHLAGSPSTSAALSPRHPPHREPTAYERSPRWPTLKAKPPWDQYIDAFSEVVPFRMKAIWGTSYGFPGPNPVEPFKDYIRRNEYVANHYWSAYPGFTTTEIVSAQHVEAALNGFQQHAAELEPEAFATAYESLLTTIQHDL